MKYALTIREMDRRFARRVVAYLQNDYVTTSEYLCLYVTVGLSTFGACVQADTMDVINELAEEIENYRLLDESSNSDP